MSLKRVLFERALDVLALGMSRPSPLPEEPRSIFVLRNNDIGDVLVITPLFEALRRRFPAARLVAGVGEWNVPVLERNPYLSGCLVMNAPWHNKYTSPVGSWGALRYIWTSHEVQTLAGERFEVGIDVLGSPWGSLLFMRAGIRCRLGVRGYAGGHTVTSAWVDYDDRTHLSRAALRFAELLGATELPPAAPQIFLTATEMAAGAQRWSVAPSRPGAPPRRILLAPGAGLPEKRWPAERFMELARLMGARPEVEVLVVGGNSERALAEELAMAAPNIRTLAGELDLRQVFAVVASADAVVTNGSFVMHVAAAFGVRALIVLGPQFQSAALHELQWGYPETQRTFGRADPHGDLASAREVFAALTQTP